MPEQTAVTSAAQRHNQLIRWHGHDHPKVAAAARDYRAASLEEHIRAVVDAAPSLTGEQVARLRGLLPEPSADPPRRPLTPGAARQPRSSRETGVRSATGGNRIAEADQQGGGGDVAA